MAKFLIDECLSPDLAEAARQRGFPESSHVVWMNKAGWKDWELKAFILDGDWTFVTRNSVDFRGPAEDPGTKGQYAEVALHAGLVCINGPATMSADAQLEMFEALLLELGDPGDMVNEVIEVTLDETGEEFTIERYPLPTEPV